MSTWKALTGSNKFITLPLFMQIPLRLTFCVAKFAPANTCSKKRLLIAKRASGNCCTFINNPIINHQNWNCWLCQHSKCANEPRTHCHIKKINEIFQQCQPPPFNTTHSAPNKSQSNTGSEQKVAQHDLQWRKVRCISSRPPSRQKSQQVAQHDVIKHKCALDWYRCLASALPQLDKRINQYNLHVAAKTVTFSIEMYVLNYRLILYFLSFIPLRSCDALKGATNEFKCHWKWHRMQKVPGMCLTRSTIQLVIIR